VHACGTKKFEEKSFLESTVTSDASRKRYRRGKGRAASSSSSPDCPSSSGSDKSKLESSDCSATVRLLSGNLNRSQTFHILGGFTFASFIPPSNATGSDAIQIVKDRFRKFWMTSVGSVANGFKDGLEQIRQVSMMKYHVQPVDVFIDDTFLFSRSLSYALDAFIF
jgi:hypothetical protein